MSDQNQKTPEEIAREVMRANDKKFAKDGLKFPRILLFVLAGINLLFVVYVFITKQLYWESLAIESGILMLFYGSMGLLCFRYPLPATIIALGGYLLYQLLILWLVPEMFVRGILWKVLIVGSLGKGIRDAWISRSMASKSNLDTLDSDLLGTD